MRLIDADAVEYHEDDAVYRWEIDAIPTADVVEVVRCRDCTWWKSIFSWNGKEHKVCVRDASEPPREQNDFCSYGERRSDDKE